MKSLFIKFLENFQNHGFEYYKKYYGIYMGVCTNNEDPDLQGKIMVKVPSVMVNQEHPEWAWPVMPWAGKDSGICNIPDVDDPVYVMFRNGNPNFPLYMGGWWPKVDGESYLPSDTYANKKPVKRFIKTKVGHEFYLNDDPENSSVGLVWKKIDSEEYSYFTFNKDGTVQVANRKGCIFEMNAKDDEERIFFVDKAGNSVTMDKDGIKQIDAFGNIFEMKKDAVQMIGSGGLLAQFPSVNFKTGGMSVGNNPQESSVKGTSWLNWFTTTFVSWVNGHIHPTGVGPSGAPVVPLQAPVAEQVLTEKLKVE